MLGFYVNFVPVIVTLNLSVLVAVVVGQRRRLTVLRYSMYWAMVEVR